MQHGERLPFARLSVLPAHDRARARLVQLRAKHELAGRRRVIAMRAASPPIAPRLQPVSARANSVTSFWL